MIETLLALIDDFQYFFADVKKKLGGLMRWQRRPRNSKGSSKEKHLTCVVL